MSALIGELEFWALLIFVPIGAALLLMVVVHWTGKRAAGLLDKALQHKNEQKPREGSGKVK
jgi:hypothetical protein